MGSTSAKYIPFVNTVFKSANVPIVEQATAVSKYPPSWLRIINSNNSKKLSVKSTLTVSVLGAKEGSTTHLLGSMSLTRHIVDDLAVNSQRVLCENLKTRVNYSGKAALVRLNLIEKYKFITMEEFLEFKSDVSELLNLEKLESKDVFEKPHVDVSGSGWDGKMLSKYVCVSVFCFNMYQVCFTLCNFTLG